MDHLTNEEYDKMAKDYKQPVICHYCELEHSEYYSCDEHLWMVKADMEGNDWE